MLAIETTGPICSVALRTKSGGVVKKESEEGLKHLTSLVPMIDEVLKDAGISVRELGCIAVSAGPGSFTGIRIGVATARALAQVLGIPAVKVPTLETFVYMGGEEAGYSVACPVFDARREQIYAGAYLLEEDGRIMTLVQGGVYDPGGFYASFERSAEALERLVKRQGGSVSYDAARQAVQSAPAVLAWAEAHGVPVSYEELEPIYMRKAEAQRKLDEKEGTEKGSSGGVVLRPAREEDVYGMSVIERLSFGEPWLEESILGDLRLEYSDYVVCERDGFVLGYAGLHRILDEGHITNIAVHPGVREQGVGSAVLRELLRRGESEGLEKFTLEVRKGDAAAVGFYGKQGFVAEGVRSEYYAKDGGGREDALIMWRREGSSGNGGAV